MRTSMKGVKPDFLPATLAKHFHGDSVQKRLPGKQGLGFRVTFRRFRGFGFGVGVQVLRF